MTSRKKTVLIGELWQEDNDSHQFMVVAEGEESMDAWVKANWINPIRWDDADKLQGYELCDTAGNYLGLDLTVSEMEVYQMMVSPALEATFQDVIDANHHYHVGASKTLCGEAVGPANELFNGDTLKGLLYLMADGYAISVGNNTEDPVERRKARLEWNRDRAESQSVWIREKYDA